MKRWFTVALALASCTTGQAQAQGSAGEAVAMQGTNDAPACASCHGERGEGQPDADIPRLAGLEAPYLLHQLSSFAEGTRQSPIMGPVALAIGEADRRAVAGFYARLPPATSPAAKYATAAGLAVGATLADRGDWSRGIPGCSQCHGGNGSGLGSSFPALTGQSAGYLENQLRAFASGARRNDPMGLMQGIAKKLDKDQIAAVSAYYSALPGLRPEQISEKRIATTVPEAPKTFTPPPTSAIPDDENGAMIRLGEKIFRDTPKYAAQFVGNSLQCSNCHLDGGRLAGSAPLWAAYVAYPAYRTKNKHVNSYSERLQGCFRYSMNGTPPPPGDKVLVALEMYSRFLSTGVPVGAEMPGRGYPKLAEPPLPFDYARGKKIYVKNCALCHGVNGEGRKAPDSKPAFPALWGPDSFNWGAGMGDITNAAAFIKANMPLGEGGKLTLQEAWDVAAYVDSHERPQDPRFTGSVSETRQKFHDSKTWMYGREVNGKVLGAHSPPSGGPQDTTTPPKRPLRRPLWHLVLFTLGIAIAILLLVRMGRKRRMAE